MFTTDIDKIADAFASSRPIYFRQIGGITWGRVINDYLNFELFEYWIGPDYPVLPASVDPEYPMEMRPKLRVILNESRNRRRSLDEEKK